MTPIRKPRPSSVAALLLATAMAHPAPATAQAPPPPMDRVEALLRERLAARGGGALVAGVVNDGESRVIAAGLPGPGGPPADAGTVFEIGSVSKVFTTTLLAEMVARGEVALGDPVRAFLPDSVGVPTWEGREITLLDLASASSGLPRQPANLRPANPADPYADYGEGALYHLLSGLALTRAPGAEYEYSNLGMGLLGHLLARRAGVSYEALVIARVLEPLGMRETSITPGEARRARLAQGHDEDLTPVPGWAFGVLAGAGAWRSTAADMLRFAEAALHPPAGPLGEAFRLAIAPRRPAGAPGMSIGLGWHVLERGSRRIAWHNGQTGGFHSFLGVDREAGTAVVLLGNVAVSDDDLGFHLLDSTAPLRPPRPVVMVDEATLERYVGRYVLAPTFVIDISREGGRLLAQATGQPRVRLYPASERRFFLRVVDAEVEFTLDDAGAVIGLVLHQDGRATPGQRTTPGP